MIRVLLITGFLAFPPSTAAQPQAALSDLYGDPLPAGATAKEALSRLARKQIEVVASRCANDSSWADPFRWTGRCRSPGEKSSRAVLVRRDAENRQQAAAIIWSRADECRVRPTPSRA
jgi:hypothetical protein